MDAQCVSSTRTIACTVEAGVALVRMQDEAGKNALSHEMTPELESVFRTLSDRNDVKVAVLAGLPEYFCTGASRNVLRELASGQVAPRDLLLPRALLDLSVPLIAAMEGHALGGGLALGLCAEVIIAARESRYGCNFIQYGFTPGMGTTGLLEYILGPALAHEMLLTGRTFRGTRFHGCCGFNYVLPRERVLGKALEIAAGLAVKPRLPLTALKASLSARKRQIFEDARSTEIIMHQLTFSRPEVAELIAEEYLE
jgi:polyketide biosynthesis enoyl-CoA hydratase PksI